MQVTLSASFRHSNSNCQYYSTDCIKIITGFAATITQQELSFGNYTLGRYAWILEEAQQLPAPAQGVLGLWEWEPPEELFKKPVVDNSKRL
jgi:hypothetical protein